MFSYARVVAGTSLPDVASIKAPVPVVQPPQERQESPLADAARKTQEPLLASPMSVVRCCLTPTSKALIDKPGGKTPDNFSAKKRKISEFALEHISPSKRLKELRNDNDSITQRALKVKSLGHMQEIYSTHSDQHGRALARAVGNVFNSTPIQTVSLSDLFKEDEHNRADFKLFQEAITDLSGETVDSPSQVRNFLTGDDVLRNTSEKNFLLTVVSFPEGHKLRFLSVSGKFYPVENGKGLGSLSVQGKQAASTQLKCHLIPRSQNAAQTPALIAHANKIHHDLKRGENKIYYLGYRDLSVFKGNKLKEWRGLPRIGTQGKDGGIHDRAKDTEYMALSGLSMLLREKPELSDLPMDIRMFSKLDMCSGCEVAATYASLQKEFSGLTSFRIYGGNKGVKPLNGVNTYSPRRFTF